MFICIGPKFINLDNINYIDRVGFPNNYNDPEIKYEIFFIDGSVLPITKDIYDDIANGISGQVINH